MEQRGSTGGGHAPGPSASSSTGSASTHPSHPSTSSSTFSTSQPKQPLQQRQTRPPSVASLRGGHNRRGGHSSRRESMDIHSQARAGEEGPSGYVLLAQSIREQVCFMNRADVLVQPRDQHPCVADDLFPPAIFVHCGSAAHLKYPYNGTGCRRPIHVRPGRIAVDAEHHFLPTDFRLDPWGGRG